MELKIIKLLLIKKYLITVCYNIKVAVMSRINYKGILKESKDKNYQTDTRLTQPNTSKNNSKYLLSNLVKVHP